MKNALMVTVALMLGLGTVSFTTAEMKVKATEGQSGSMMGPGMTGMMGGSQMGHMMPMMQMMEACTKMMNQMSAMMGQHGSPQPQAPQPEKK